MKKLKRPRRCSYCTDMVKEGKLVGNGFFICPKCAMQYKPNVFVEEDLCD